MMANIANYAWLDLLSRIRTYGDNASPRGQMTQELLGCQSKFDMRFPVITLSARKLGYRFMAAEAAWILSGDNRVSSIKPYSKDISNYSDDGIQYFGAYGPRFRDQIRHVIQSLEVDRDSRQALVTLWRPNPPKTKDVPCTISLHWMIREDSMHCFVSMRSSDVWLGVPYDWFNFTMMTGYVMLMLKSRGWDHLHLGTMHFTANSQHIYERNFENASKLFSPHQEHVFQTPEFNPYFVESPDDLVDWLWYTANSEKTLQGGFHAAK